MWNTGRQVKQLVLNVTWRFPGFKQYSIKMKNHVLKQEEIIALVLIVQGCHQSSQETVSSRFLAMRQQWQTKSPMIWFPASWFIWSNKIQCNCTCIYLCYQNTTSLKNYRQILSLFKAWKNILAKASSFIYAREWIMINIIVKWSM